ncbi:hypothetical protein Tco_0938563 [Tanacetum coccineum]|uniref:Reverse transcriptase domain-containing protein n=1 Tax=Tanacetum coccineum TaxID=301880 RepID=A0ABQ5DK86_9ASTR
MLVRGGPIRGGVEGGRRCGKVGLGSRGVVRKGRIWGAWMGCLMCWWCVQVCVGGAREWGGGGCIVRERRCDVRMGWEMSEKSTFECIWKVFVCVRQEILDVHISVQQMQDSEVQGKRPKKDLCSFACIKDIEKKLDDNTCAFASCKISIPPVLAPFRNVRIVKPAQRTLKTGMLDSTKYTHHGDTPQYSEEEVTETMVENMEQYMSKTRADYGSGVVRPKIEDKDNFELKGQFLKELRTNTFSGSDHEDANQHIEKVLEIVDLFHIPNITIDQVMLKAFPRPLPEPQVDG